MKRERKIVRNTFFNRLRRWLNANRKFMAAGMIASQIGCATIINGTTQEVEIQTNPRGARVVVDGILVNGNYVGGNKVNTKCRLYRDNKHKVEITHPGCFKQTFYIRNGLTAWTMMNTLLGFPFIAPAIFGFATDHLTGSNFKLEVPEGGFNIDLDCDKDVKDTSPISWAPKQSN